MPAKVTATFAALLVLAAAVTAADKPTAKTTYTVVSIKTGKVAKQSVMPSAKVKAESAQLKVDFQKQTKDWLKAKRDFAKDKANKGKKFNQPKPVLSVLITLKAGLASQDAAEQWLADYKKRTEKPKAKKPATPKPNKKAKKTKKAK